MHLDDGFAAGVREQGRLTEHFECERSVLNWAASRP